ncbi:Fic family protein [Haliea sp.]|jgi:Fic family protein|uniref:Fic family protein n=1 Tax=Haliea sp. TaxID=1932666 RepID=UPI003528BC1B|tara:strand:- start:111 stop:1520 length:1410 start_codon:yes stop_codon:yes gene_type:complete
MPKQVSEEELEAIRRAVGGFPEGASIDEISDAIEPSIHRRTLQRRLAVLVERKQLLLEGGGRGSRYKVPAIRTDVNIEVGGAQLSLTSGIPEVEIYTPISEVGAEIKRLVRQPIQHRRPVGYNRDFIGTYQPNRTFYLPEEVRKHLLEIGQSQAGVLAAGTYALQIYNRLLIDLTWNSSRLEGNTYSLLETERLIELGDSAEGRDALETQMILNHKAAIELLVQSAADTGFNRYTICNLHALLSENLLPDPAACGRLRQHSVGIGASVFQPLQGGALINECFDEVLFKADAIKDPFEQAFFAMVQLPYLQAFDDVNKRVSRLAANIPFIRENLSPLSFVDVPEKVYIDGLLGIYELNRTELLADVFVWAYERSCARYSAARQSLGDPDPFRLRYREFIAQLVSNIVRSALNKREAVSAIKQFIEQEIVEQDRARFMEMVETELTGLHEGNIARYKLKPSEFENWLKRWS